MAVKIVTDSLSDITEDYAKELGITVVPLTVIFGHEQYLDRVTITTDQFYDRLVNDTVWPTTTQPTPAAFGEVYNELAKETDEILVITVSGELSGTYESAMSAKNLVEKKCRIEVIDSRQVAGGLGLIVIAAVNAVKVGASMDDLIALVHSAMDRTHFIIYFETLTYLAKGGRIGKAKELLGSVLSIKQILTIKDGGIAPLTRKRSLAAGMDYLYNFVAGFPDVEACGVEHTTTKDIADKLAERIGTVYTKSPLFRSVVSPVLGVHGGPGAIAVTVLEAEKK